MFLSLDFCFRVHFTIYILKLIFKNRNIHVLTVWLLLVQETLLEKTPLYRFSFVHRIPVVCIVVSIHDTQSE